MCWDDGFVAWLWIKSTLCYFIQRWDSNRVLIASLNQKTHVSLSNFNVAVLHPWSPQWFPHFTSVFFNYSCDINLCIYYVSWSSCLRKLSGNVKWGLTCGYFDWKWLNVSVEQLNALLKHVHCTFRLIWVCSQYVFLTSGPIITGSSFFGSILDQYVDGWTSRAWSQHKTLLVKVLCSGWRSMLTW